MRACKTSLQKNNTNKRGFGSLRYPYAHTLPFFGVSTFYTIDPNHKARYPKAVIRYEPTGGFGETSGLRSGCRDALGLRCKGLAR